ncbi:MAG: NAD(P)-binding domain-containing protein [Anaerolineae bacterium]|nr:NAD(P)-binding domain-containing protein [Anaerolineae bacterium]
MPMALETIIIGGGQAGLALSYFLTQQGHAHVILEQAAQAAHPWRNERWDSFTFVTPNSMSSLPGLDIPADDPGGFLPRDQIVAYFEEYIRRFKLPIRYGVRVTAVEPNAAGYRVTTDGETLEAANVVVATGLFQSPKIPPFSHNLPAGIVQLHSGQYRNPASLPLGAVLVVGSGQSGCQIAEDVYEGGRKVYLSVGSSIRVPRRYRGGDCFVWLYRLGFFDRTPDKLPSPKARFAANPHLSGARGGHTTNLHQYVRDGMVLLGHIQAIQGETVTLAPDLMESLEKVDKGEANILAMIDGFIARSGIDAPPEQLPQLRDGYDAEELLELDLRAAGITSVIWATGYSFDFSMVKLPVFDDDGFPITQRGVTEYPGLYFLGMVWLHKQKSGLLCGVGEDAEYLAQHIAGQKEAMNS